MHKRIAQRLPWCDAAGRVSLLKLAVFISLFLPAIWMAASCSSIEWQFPSPYVPLIYHSGLWATYLLLAGLAITPLRRILDWPRLAQLKRMLGLGAFAYLLLHLVAWIGLRAWDWRELGSELALRPTLWIATLSTFGLSLLAATSLDAAMRRLGARWKQLHRSVYILACLAVVHFLMSPGSLQGAPFLMAGLFFWLMAWRGLDRRGLGTHVPVLFSLGMATAAFTLLLELVWLATYQHGRLDRTPLESVLANFDPTLWTYLGPAPFAWILALTLAPAGFLLIRSIYSRLKYHAHLGT